MNQVELLLSTLLIVSGYFVVYQITSANCRNRRILPIIAVVVLIIYACFVGAMVVLYFYSGNNPIVIFSCLLLVALMGFFALLRFCLKIRHQLKTGPLLLFFLYIAALLFVTLFVRVGSIRDDIQMEPFHQVKEALVTKNWESVEHNVQNVILFLPMGILIPLINRHHFQKFSYTFLAAMIVSTCIETTQYLFRIGTCDIDDIIANTLGAVCGFLFAWVYLRVFHTAQD